VLSLFVCLVFSSTSSSSSWDGDWSKRYRKMDECSRVGKTVIIGVHTYAKCVAEGDKISCADRTLGRNLYLLS
jgi:hypothetical protein